MALKMLRIRFVMTNILIKTSELPCSNISTSASKDNLGIFFYPQQTGLTDAKAVLCWSYAEVGYEAWKEDETQMSWSLCKCLDCICHKYSHNIHTIYNSFQWTIAHTEAPSHLLSCLVLKLHLKNKSYPHYPAAESSFEMELRLRPWVPYNLRCVDVMITNETSPSGQKDIPDDRSLWMKD